MIVSNGRVKHWNDDRGFGFIGREGQSDVFAHVSALGDDRAYLEVGERVEFEMGLDKRSGKERALNVRVVG